MNQGKGSTDAKPFANSHVDSDSLNTRDFSRTQIGSEKSGADASINKNRHADNKHAPEDGDIFERDESASLF